MGQTWVVGLSQRPVSASQLLCTHQQSTQLHIMCTQLLVCAHYAHTTTSICTLGHTTTDICTFCAHNY